MKKWLILLVSLCLLTGCAATPTPDSGGGTEESVSPLAASTAEESVRYTVETRTEEDSVKADDGTVLYSYRDELPHLTAYTDDEKAQPVENAVTEAFNSQFDQWQDEADQQDMIQTAQEDYDFRKQESIPWTGYEKGFTYTAYQTDRLVSIAAQSYYYTGGAHPNTAYTAWNFDLEEGRFIPMDQLGRDAAFQQAVTEEIIRQMTERAGELDIPVGDMYWSDYEEIVALWTNYAVSFDKSGMTVTFSPYDLASYAAGPQAFLIPYELLLPHLSDYGLELLQIPSAK